MFIPTWHEIYSAVILPLPLIREGLLSVVSKSIPDKKRKFSFQCENVTCHEILISDDIFLKLECGVDEYLYLPFEGTNHIKANGKWFLEALIKCYCLHLIPSMFYYCKVLK